MEKLIITAAICGAEVTKKRNPTVPYTVEEMVRGAEGAFKTGAVVIHIHVHEDDDALTQDRGQFRVVLDAIKEACSGMTLIPFTGDAVNIAAEERLQPTELFPEMATLDCNTCNFGDDVFTNDMPTMRAFGKRMMENHIEPKYEYFEIGHLDAVMNMVNKGEVSGVPMQFNFVLSISSCTPATMGNLGYLVEQIPAGSTWTVTGVGRGAWPIVAADIIVGGNVRVGFEDDIHPEESHKTASNGKLVEKVVRLAKELGHEIATPDKARKTLPLA